MAPELDRPKIYSLIPGLNIDRRKFFGALVGQTFLKRPKMNFVPAVESFIEIGMKSRSRQRMLNETT